MSARGRTRNAAAPASQHNHLKPVSDRTEPGMDTRMFNKVSSKTSTIGRDLGLHYGELAADAAVWCRAVYFLVCVCVMCVVTGGVCLVAIVQMPTLDPFDADWTLLLLLGC